ncbi:hypothetical protein [Nostoc sp.]|uniref:hypothetical protein n=1 Tax=Nostoc sp. TaxID=1180 RepID=UPI002FEF4885
MAYTDISRGVRLAADHAKYIAWLQKDTEARQAAYAAITTPGNKVQTARISGYLAPFSATGTTLIYAPAKLIGPTQTGRGATLAATVKDILSEYSNLTLDGSEVGLTGVKYKPATMTLTERITTATTKESSRITGRKYYRHENDSVTGKFGKKVVADDYDSVVAAIRTHAKYIAFFNTGANAAFNKVRFVPEGV